MEAGRRCVLGGVELESARGPVGHSDADALLHALADAVLGAAGLDDLGTLFSDGDPAWKNADSARFVTEAVRLAAARGLRPLSADAVVITDAPRLAPHRAAIRARLAELLGLPTEHVTLKGKTTALGLVDRVGAQVVVLLTGSPA